VDPDTAPPSSPSLGAELDYQQAARDLVRALRGRRSQRALSRRLGYTTNVIYTWEAGRRWPTAAEALRLAERTGVELRAALTRFFPNPPTG
jgi:transcriptional regulator with XRE-family HTH domain